MQKLLLLGNYQKASFTLHTEVTFVEVTQQAVVLNLRVLFSAKIVDVCKHVVLSLV